MATIREYFDKAFPSQMTVDKKLQAITSDASVEIDARIHLDVDAHVKFISLFVPAGPLPEKLIESVFRNINTVMALQGVINVTLPRAGAEWSGTSVHFENSLPEPIKIRVTQVDGLITEADKLPFSGRVYIYSEQEFTVESKSQLQQMCRPAGLILSFRGPLYATQIDQHQRPKAFVCHDFRDKKEVALPIALGLQQLLCPVWYDEFSLVVGQSLRESIERGIKECAHCILVLSPNFLSNGGWPKREYTMAFTKELVEDRNVLLPVWHGISRDDVFSYSLLLADRLGVLWSLGKEEVCRRLYVAIEKEA